MNNPGRLCAGPLAAHLICGSTLAGYVVESRIAAGGQGAVFKAQDAEGRTVALKVQLLEDKGSSDGRKRFLREALLSTTVN